ncbi:hypothetical protein J3B02_001113 [Coemansia erecta]|nr:hypothetical protein J3B02_001113 [Coemansia erecta]
MTFVDHLVVGAGVVGLAVARELSQKRNSNSSSTLLIDKNQHFGMETSSRNSEVIHGGIYYPKHSIRTRLCIYGKALIYEYCAKNDIPYKRIGKLVVAQNEEQAEYLYRLDRHCAEIDVPAEVVSQKRVLEMEPSVSAYLALHSPTTGIIDTHAFMTSLLKDLTDNGADFAASTEAVAIQFDDPGYRVLVSTGDAETPYMCINAATVVNAAGLWADRVANMLATQSKHDWRTKYKLHFAKGRYYMYAGGPKIKVQRLIYPVPDKHITSLGTHLTIDMGGAIRFGPDLEWIQSNEDYGFDRIVDGQRSAPSMDAVAKEISKYLPRILPTDLEPGYAGIRPKLQPPGGAFRDFVVQEETDAGLPGFVNLMGIESPGLTSSLAIARMVEKLV